MAINVISNSVNSVYTIVHALYQTVKNEVLNNVVNNINNIDKENMKLQCLCLHFQLGASVCIHDYKARLIANI